MPGQTDQQWELFKIQRPIIGDAFLVYNEDRSVEFHLHLPKEHNLHTLMGEDLKIYAFGRLEDDNFILAGDENIIRGTHAYLMDW